METRTGSTKDSKKEAWTTPKLIVYGDVEVITRGNSDGAYLDQGFPVGTQKDDLTFSG